MEDELKCRTHQVTRRRRTSDSTFTKCEQVYFFFYQLWAGYWNTIHLSFLPCLIIAMILEVLLSSSFLIEYI